MYLHHMTGVLSDRTGELAEAGGIQEFSGNSRGCWSITFASRLFLGRSPPSVLITSQSSHCSVRLFAVKICP